MSKLKIKGNACGMMNISDSTRISSGLQNSFNEGLNKTVSTRGRVTGTTNNHFAGFDLFESADFSDHTAGDLYTEGGNLTIATSGGVSSDGATLTFTRETTTNAANVKAGDMFAIPSVELVCVNGRIVLGRNIGCNCCRRCNSSSWNGRHRG